MAEKLKQISPATIDRKLKPYREAMRYQGCKGSRRRSLLRQKIPVRLTEWDISKQGYLEIDLVVHCGCSTRGEYVNDMLYRYCCREALDFTRSRPYHKNDNAYIEEKTTT